MSFSASALIATATSAPARAQDMNEEIALWPSAPPNGPGPSGSSHLVGGAHYQAVDQVGRPSLTVYRPQKPNGMAVLIVPGGGYSFERIDAEGSDPALRFAAAGLTAFVLVYRLPSEGWKEGAQVPLQDAQRAMRLVRANASRFAIDPARIGILGFSAGGHVAASLATRSTEPVYRPVDAADALEARPSYAGLLYPVITMLPPYAHEASREKLLGRDPSKEQRAVYSCERLVSADTPPTFLVAANDDPDVPVENSLAMLASLRAKHVPAELHLFERGGHGFGLAAAELPASAWPDLFLRWLARFG